MKSSNNHIDEQSLRLNRRIDAAYTAWHIADSYKNAWAKAFWNTVICDLMAKWRKLHPTKIN